jgi:AcrR family transcriptional regulator
LAVVISPKRESIFQAAIELFAVHGFENTSMSQITHAAGAADGTVFYHFKSKTRLFTAILEDTRELLVRELSQLVDHGASLTGLELLAETIAAFLSLATEQRDRFLILQRPHAYEQALTDPECRQQLSELYDTIIQVFERPIKRGVEDGSMRPVGVHKTALILFSLFEGLMWLEANKLYAPAALYEEALDMCRRMLAAEPGRATHG